MSTAVWAAAAFLAVALSGCAATTATQPETGQERLGLCTTPPLIWNAAANGHFAHVLVQNTGGGLNTEFDWSWDPEHLSRLQVEVSWQATDPTADELHVRAMVLDQVPWDEQPAAQGASPLLLDIQVLDESPKHNPQIDFGPKEDMSGPIFAAKLAQDQNVTVTIQETYRCSDTVHP
ncbi:MAG: hypothetical protein QOC71_1713 [Thermoplasmata archaeon]|nr:hypothetical protein [Thermoplasmata archaeon]